MSEQIYVLQYIGHNIQGIIAIAEDVNKIIPIYKQYLLHPEDIHKPIYNSDDNHTYWINNDINPYEDIWVDDNIDEAIKSYKLLNKNSFMITPVINNE